MPRGINNRTAEQSARLYHKFDNARGSNYAQVGLVDLNVAKTREEELVIIAGRCQVGAKTVKIVHGVVHHSCSADDVKKVPGEVTKAMVGVERAMLKEPKFSFGPPK